MYIYWSFDASGKVEGGLPGAQSSKYYSDPYVDAKNLSAGPSWATRLWSNVLQHINWQPVALVTCYLLPATVTCYLLPLGIGCVPLPWACSLTLGTRGCQPWQRLLLPHDFDAQKSRKTGPKASKKQHTSIPQSIKNDFFDKLYSATSSIRKPCF